MASPTCYGSSRRELLVPEECLTQKCFCSCDRITCGRNGRVQRLNWPCDCTIGARSLIWRAKIADSVSILGAHPVEVGLPRDSSSIKERPRDGCPQTDGGSCVIHCVAQNAVSGRASNSIPSDAYLV